MDISQEEYDTAASELAEINALVAAGILTEELYPEQSFLHWDVIKPDELPEWLGTNYEKHGEVRWYSK